MFDAKPVGGATTGTPINYAVISDVGAAYARTEPVGEIIVEGRLLEKRLAELHEGISSLEARLLLVLKPVADAGVSVAPQQAPTPMRSGIAEGIAETNRKIAAACDRLHRLQQHIDL